MPRLMKKRLLLADIETTYGVEKTLTIANAIVCGDIQLNGIEAKFQKRKLIRPYLGNPGSVKVGQQASVKFGVELAGSGAAGTAPAYSKLLRACGLAETINAGVSAVYTPVSANFDSTTMNGHDDGLLYKLLGTRGNVELQMSAGDIGVLAFEKQGLYGGTPTVVSAPTGTMPNYLAPVAVNKTNSSLITLGAATYPWESCNITLGNSLDHLDLVGHEEQIISDRDPIAKVVMELSATEERTLILAVENRTELAFSVTHGITAGNIVQVAGPKVVLTNPSRQEVNGVMLTAFDLELTPGAGNDELTFTIK